MRLILIIVFIFSLTTLNAQNKVIIKYYDTLFKVVPKENSTYYYQFEDRDSFYNCTAYYSSSNKLYSKFMAVDSNLNGAIGTVICYYESGKIKDSMFYYPNGKIIFEYQYYENSNKKRVTKYGKESGTYDTWAFYENGKLWAHVYKRKAFDKLENYVFDEEGNQISDYIFEQPSEFPGGPADWLKYIESNLNRNLPIENGAPPGKYTVVVNFIIDTTGAISDVQAENDPGYGTKEEAERIIKNSTKWIPAIQFNQPVISHHKQSITFIVSAQR